MEESWNGLFPGDLHRGNGKEIPQAEADNTKWISRTSFFFFFKSFYVMVICLVSLRDQVFNAKIVVMYCKVFNIYQSKVEDTYRRSKKEKVMVGRGTWNTIIQFLLLIN